MIARLARVSDRWQLYRDTTTGWVAGVCAGIGLRLGIRPLWIRLAFTALAFVAILILSHVARWHIAHRASRKALGAAPAPTSNCWFLSPAEAGRRP